MLVRCPSCSARFNVPDEKVAGKRARMKCKKCEAVILIDGSSLAAPQPLEQPAQPLEQPAQPVVQPPLEQATSTAQPPRRATPQPLEQPTSRVEPQELRGPGQVPSASAQAPRTSARSIPTPPAPNSPAPPLPFAAPDGAEKSAAVVSPASPRVEQRTAQAASAASLAPLAAQPASNLWEVAEPSGARHRFEVAELKARHVARAFEPGTLVQPPGSDGWFPPYDIPELGELPPYGPPSLDESSSTQKAAPPSARPQQLTFSDETVMLGVAESAALNRQAFGADAPVPPSESVAVGPAAASSGGPDYSDFDDEAKTIVRTIDSIKMLGSPSKGPSRGPLEGVVEPLPPSGRAPQRSQVPPLPHQQFQGPLSHRSAAPRMRSSSTLLGIPAPAGDGSATAADFEDQARVFERPTPSPVPQESHVQELGARGNSSGRGDASTFHQPPARSASTSPTAATTPAPSGLDALSMASASSASSGLAPGSASANEKPTLLTPSARGHVQVTPSPMSPLGSAPGSSRTTVSQRSASASSALLGMPANPRSMNLSHPALDQQLLSAPNADAFSARPEGRSLGGWLVTFLVLLALAAGAAGVYLLQPRLFAKGRAQLTHLVQRVASKVGWANQNGAPTSIGPAFDTMSAGRVLDRAAEQAARCAEPTGPTGRGRVRVLYSPSGHATSAAVSAPFHETSVGRCLVELFRATEVPAFGGEPVLVSKTFTVR